MQQTNNEKNSGTLLGIDIGGTNCSVVLGRQVGSLMEILHRMAARPTAKYTSLEILKGLAKDAIACMEYSERGGLGVPKGVGISCGGPLNSRKGLILSPPNLPGWDEVPVTEFFAQKTELPVWLCNDANACALAEWKYGAGQGSSHMIFLTFGTGLGAGLILDGKLYEGANGMAGEVGHMRLAEFGPVGYGKSGSFEGFCSGGGIAQLARTMVQEQWQMGARPALCSSEEDLQALSAQTVGRAAKEGDELALAILAVVGQKLGKGLAVLVDIFNPQKIVLGSIFARCQNEIWPHAAKVLQREALFANFSACEVLPCALGEEVGDIAALTVAAYNLENGEYK